MTGRKVDIMKLFLLDVVNNKTQLVNCNGLDDYYKYIGCKYIDIVQRTIGDVPVTIICDDEALLNATPKVSAVDVVGLPALFGNLLVAGGQVVDGELTELTTEEIKQIMFNTALVTTSDYKNPYKIFVEIDY